MALAKQLFPAVSIGSVQAKPPTRGTFLGALVLSLFCCVLAFFVLFLHDRKHVNIMVNEQVAPGLLSSRSATPVSAPPLETAPKTTMEAGYSADANSSLAVPTKRAGNQFTLLRGGLGIIGSLRVRVTHVDFVKHTYDLDVMVGSRFAPHRRLKANEPLWIAANHGKGSIKIVVDTLAESGVSGYWIPSNRLAHITPRARRRHVG